jgi:flagellum-specific ATP synthase
VAVGTSCEIQAAGGRVVAAEVVGFAGSQALLMPFGDVKGIGEGCAVFPRPAPARWAPARRSWAGWWTRP